MFAYYPMFHSLTNVGENMIPLFFAILNFRSTKHLFNCIDICYKFGYFLPDKKNQSSNDGKDNSKFKNVLILVFYHWCAFQYEGIEEETN